RVQSALRSSGAHVVEREGGHIGISRRELLAHEVSMLESRVAAKPAPCQWKHVGISIDPDDSGVRHVTLAPSRQRPGPNTEIDDRADAGTQRASGLAQHGLVIRNERPNTVIVLAKWNAEVRRDAHRPTSPVTEDTKHGVEAMLCLARVVHHQRRSADGA